MSFLKRAWHFIWHEDSIASWFTTIILAVIIVKFVFYPILGLFLGAKFPIVAVVSSSMEHNKWFEDWWPENNNPYNSLNITKEEFIKYSFRNGFNKGDLMILIGAKNIKRGDVLVYYSPSLPNPIIHRAVIINDKISTKGDNVNRIQEFEKEIPRDRVIGKAILRIPFLGYIKIIFTYIIISPLIKLWGFMQNAILS